MEWCSYFRCKDGIQKDRLVELLKEEAADYKPYPETSVSVTENTVLHVVAFYRVSFQHDPQWLDFLAVFTGEAHGHDSRGQSHSALILVGYNGHHYILTYGAAHTIPKKLPVERRFGKIVVSNGKLQDEVREITANVTGTFGKQRIERRGRGGPTGLLEVPRNAHMAKRLSAKLDLHVEHVASGDVSIRCISAKDANELRLILDQLEEWWNEGQENDQTLANLDRIIEVKDQDIIQTLNSRRLQDIVRGNHSPFCLCLEHDDLWDATSIEYFANRKRYKLSVTEEYQLFSILNQEVVTRGGNPEAVRYEAIVPTRNSNIQGYLIDNLSYETQLPSETDVFVYESGGWYRAKSTWRDQVDQDLLRLTQQSERLLYGLKIPVAASINETEDDYVNRFYAEFPAADCLKLHRVFPPGSKLELCDVCLNGKYLFFIKRGSDRNACCDVVQQALQSARALTEVGSSFHNWVQSQFQLQSWKIDLTQRSALVFCVLLLTGKPSKAPTKFTLRAKDSLSGHLRDIESYGFQAAVKIA